MKVFKHPLPGRAPARHRLARESCASCKKTVGGNGKTFHRSYEAHNGGGTESQLTAHTALQSQQKVKLQSRGSKLRSELTYPGQYELTISQP